MRFGERGYAWHAILEVEGGGLIQAGDQDYYNLAPATGYVPRYEHRQEQQSIDEAQSGKIKWTWRGETKETFYVKSKNRRYYARVGIGIHSRGRNDNDTVGSLGLGVWLNPNGSRNLEFDPAKAITPPR